MKPETKLSENHSYTLITGASSGIGKALALECAARGMNLFLVALPLTGLPQLSAELISKYGITCHVLEIDLTHKLAHHRISRYVKRNMLCVNVLINNVGIGFNGKLESMAEDKVHDMLMLNMRTTTMLVRAFLPAFRTLPKAYILNIGSLAGFMPLPGKCVYSATKAYIFYLTRSLHHELKGSNVSVSGVFPAGVPTNKATIQRIAEAGWISRKIASSPEQVAGEAISGMLRNKEIIIPGKRLKVFFWLSSMLPQGLILKLMAKEFVFSKY
jgi:uncharacterized protein